MKKSAYVILPLSIVALISLAFIIGRKYTSDTISHSGYTIKNETARKYVGAYRDREQAQGKKRGEYVESFSIPAAEVRDIMNALTTISNGDLSKMKVRFYKAINDKNKETLVISVANEQGKDVTYYKDKNGNQQSAIFDFTMPCPDACGDGGTGEFNSDVTKK